MSISRRQFLHLTASATALVTVPRVAWGQGYPSRPITMIVPYAAGGPTDVIGRIVAEGMRAALAQPIIVENVSGAAGNLGVGRAVRLAADGYALSIGDWATHVVNGAIYSLPYDVLKDFEPVALLVSNPYLVVARKSMPASDLKGLIAWLKANPGKASVGTAGVGTPPHLGAVLFEKLAGVRIQFVPYRGGGASYMQDLVGGQIDMIVDNPANALPQVRAGAIKVYAVTAMSRMAAAPDIPTVDEAGLPGCYLSNWKALWVPRGTPKDIIAKLNAAVVRALADPVVPQRLFELGQEIFPRGRQTPDALADFQKAEIDKWWPVIKAANIKVE
jgi:tripartite-type tricarboxylate transporter receptor subunit TctC